MVNIINSEKITLKSFIYVLVTKGVEVILKVKLMTERDYGRKIGLHLFRLIVRSLSVHRIENSANKFWRVSQSKRLFIASNGFKLFTKSKNWQEGKNLITPLINASDNQWEKSSQTMLYYSH